MMAKDKQRRRAGEQRKPVHALQISTSWSFFLIHSHSLGSDVELFFSFFLSRFISIPSLDF